MYPKLGFYGERRPSKEDKPARRPVSVETDLVPKPELDAFVKQYFRDQDVCQQQAESGSFILLSLWESKNRSSNCGVA